MISTNFITPQEMQMIIAHKAQAKRLAFNLSQKTLSEKSGVSYGVLKKFERTGQISLESLLKLALILGSLDDFYNVLSIDKPETAVSLDELIKQKPRKRGRI